MKKEMDLDKICALCEHCRFIEYDNKYICKYRNRCKIVEETDLCRHFRFDLLKVCPPPRLPYTAEEIDDIPLPGAGTD